MNNVLHVVCLCAQWCSVCGRYAETFATAERVSGMGSAVCWQWVDVEDQADLLGGIEVENFPTLLIFRGEQVQFFGVVTPHADTLQRLVRQAQGGRTLTPSVPPEVLVLARRLEGGS